MTDLRDNLIKLASELPKGDPTRRKLLAAVKESAEDVWSHWGMTEKKMREEAAKQAKRLKAKDAKDFLRKWEDNEPPGLPPDGSRGQYMAWGRSLATLLED